MKFKIIIGLSLVTISSAFSQNFDVEKRKAVTESGALASIWSATYQENGDREHLLINLNQNGANAIAVADIAAPTPGRIMARLADAKVEGNFLAIVLDWDLWLQYRLYEKNGNTWSQIGCVDFSAINLKRRQNLCLVQITDLNKVTLTFIKQSEDFLLNRQRKVVHGDDPKEVFEFGTNGAITRNGVNYLYNSGADQGN